MKRPYYVDPRAYSRSGWSRAFDGTEEKTAEFEKQFDSTEESLLSRFKRWLKKLDKAIDDWLFRDER